MYHHLENNGVSMYSRLLGCVLFVAGFTVVHAETISPESMALAQILTSGSWSSFEQVMPILVAELEADFKKQGTSDRAATAFSDEFRKAMTRQAVEKIFAQEIALSMSRDEQKAALAFVQTSAGKKLMSIAELGLTAETAAESLIDEVCPLIRKSQLSPADLASLHICS